MNPNEQRPLFYEPVCPLTLILSPGGGEETRGEVSAIGRGRDSKRNLFLSRSRQGGIKMAGLRRKCRQLSH
jgi:hypothetical protein